MSIDDHGFLSEDIVQVQQQIRERYAHHFDLIHRVNSFCQQGKHRLSIHSRDGQQVLAVCLLIKLLDDIQGAVLLLERGLASPCRSLLRVGIEALFILANICQHDDFYKSFIHGSQIDRLRLARAIRENPAPAFDDVRPYATPELIERLANEIKEAETTKEAAAELAGHVNLKHLYDGAYRLLSQDIHSSPQVLEKYLVMDDADVLERIEWGPVTTDLKLELDTAPAIMLTGFDAINRLFDLNLDAEIQSFDAELRALIEKPLDGMENDQNTTSR